MRSFDFFEKAITGEEIEPADLDALLSEQVTEDQFIEYKNAKVLNNGRDANMILREYLSGFANSEGGVLIFGVDKEAWKITSCTAPGGGDLAEWASRSMTEIAYQFSSIPRFFVVHHPDGEVLIASVARSNNLIFCNDRSNNNRPAYHFRIHDQTLKAPEYLIADLLLGRRQSPHVVVSEVSLRGKLDTVDRNSSADFRFSLVISIENVGLNAVERTIVGVVLWDKKTGENISPISNYLLSNIEVVQESDFQLNHIQLDSLDLRPFNKKEEIIGRNNHFIYPFQVLGDFHYFDSKFAIYIIPDGSAPIWYQGEFVTNQSLASKERGTPLPIPASVYPVYGKRPVVEVSKVDTPS